MIEYTKIIKGNKIENTIKYQEFHKRQYQTNTVEYINKHVKESIKEAPAKLQEMRTRRINHSLINNEETTSGK